MLFDWLIPTLMRLESFFSNFNGSPHQRAAIQQLAEDMPPELLSPKAEWFQIWKAGGKIVPFGVPYMSQMDLENGEEKCFTTAMAMLAKHYGAVEVQEEYEEIREIYGDTTSVLAQVKALEHVGLRPDFVQNGTLGLIEAEIDAGRPVGVGWLHRGDLSRGEPAQGFGHWSVVIGYTENFLIMHDPRGEYDLERGVLKEGKTGKTVYYPRDTFQTRWAVEGGGSGWAMLVDPFPPMMQFDN